VEKLKPALACLVGAMVVGGVGVVAFLALLLWAAEDAGPKRIAECRTSLRATERCDGLDSSWTECSWSFHAEGRPDRGLCSEFLSRPKRGGEPKDYDDVEAFEEQPCAEFGLPGSLRCFSGVRREHEATHRYLQAFDYACRTSVVLRSCNEPLRTYGFGADAP
jgi:hypothetical protein